MEFYWLAVFESFTVIPVAQGEEGQDGSIVQAVAQKWNRSGTVTIAPGQTTDTVVNHIVTECKGSGDVPADALLIDITVLPNVLVNGYGQ